MSQDQGASWDSYWGGDSNLDYWLEPDQAVIGLTKQLDRSRVKDVLDMGCGVGRHTLWFARAGFGVAAADISDSALAVLRKRVGEDKRVRVVKGAYSEDLFPADSFDLTLAWNVLYHGRREDIKKATGLIHKWLRPNGLLFFTCPTRRDAKYGSGEEVAPNTFRSLNSVHPGDVHYFADEGDIRDFLVGFNLISEETDEHYWDNKGSRQFSSYWLIQARKSSHQGLFE
jgi:tellurite methyltransferase